MTGAVPGLGKTTLVRRLGGGDVVTLLEDEIAGRPELADVMESFRRTGSATRELLLEATARLAATSRGRGPTVVVQDMLLPFTPSLLAWGWSDDEIVRFFGEIREACTGIELVELHLDGPARPALDRAIAREDDGWLAWMIDKVTATRTHRRP